MPGILNGPPDREGDPLVEIGRLLAGVRRQRDTAPHRTASRRGCRTPACGCDWRRRGRPPCRAGRRCRPSPGRPRARPAAAGPPPRPPISPPPRPPPPAAHAARPAAAGPAEAAAPAGTRRPRIRPARRPCRQPASAGLRRQSRPSRRTCPRRRVRPPGSLTAHHHEQHRVDLAGRARCAPPNRPRCRPRTPAAG